MHMRSLHSGLGSSSVLQAGLSIDSDQLSYEPLYSPATSYAVGCLCLLTAAQQLGEQALMCPDYHSTVQTNAMTATEGLKGVFGVLARG